MVIKVLIVSLCAVFAGAASVLFSIILGKSHKKSE